MPPSTHRPTPRMDRTWFPSSGDHRPIDFRRAIADFALLSSAANPHDGMVLYIGWGKTAKNLSRMAASTLLLRNWKRGRCTIPSGFGFNCLSELRMTFRPDQQRARPRALHIGGCGGFVAHRNALLFGMTRAPGYAPSAGRTQLANGCHASNCARSRELLSRSIN